MTQKITDANIESTTLASFTGPLISSVLVTDSSYNILDDTAVSTDGGYIIINGQNFISGAQVLFGSTPATSVTFVDSTALRVQVPALSSGSYVMYVQNADGSTAIRLNGITSSSIPVWSTGSTLTEQPANSSFSISLSATSDSNVTFTLANGSSLPSGTTLSANGLFSGTISVSVETIFNFSVNAIDEQNQDATRSFSITITAGDLNFRDTILLLNGDVTNNTWITDSGPNSFSVTANGDARPTSFSPYKTGWSNYFDGAGDYLTVSSGGISLAGDFTIECWLYPTGTKTYSEFITSGSANFELLLNNTTLSFFTIGLTHNTPVKTNEWCHVALTRSGTTVRLYLNGIESTNSGTSSTTYTILNIGSYTGGAETYLGYIADVRVVNGTAVYMGNFTPPTAPLTAITNTALLTCQSNRFIDNSTNNFTITRTGDVIVNNFSPYVETDMITGSGYFDASGDFLTCGSQPQFSFGTGDFTIEYWVYVPALGTTSRAVFYISPDLTGTAFGLLLRMEGSPSNSWRLYVGNGTSWVISSGNVGSFTNYSPLNTWQHHALTRNGSTLKFFINGTETYSTTNSTDMTYQNLFIANYASITHLGYISDFRILKGTSLYNSSFTPPTSPLTAIANTSILTLQSNIGESSNRFIDVSGLNSLITKSGNTSQGTFSPFTQTGWSNYFDGTGDFLSVPNNAGLNPETSDFVMEAWVYITGLTGSNQGINGKGVPGTDGYSFYVTNGLVLSFIWNGTGGATITAGTLNLHKWHHVAVVRNNGVIRLYLDGVGAASSTVCTTNITTTNAKAIGQARGANPIFGYISNYRMIKGSRPEGYDATSSTLSVPTSPLSAISNTSLLVCQSNRFVDNSANNLSITINGDTSVETFSPFNPTTSWSPTIVGGSTFFDGTGDFLTVPDRIELRPGTSNFTLEAWIYRTLAGTAHTIYAKGGASTGIQLQVTSTNVLRFTHTTTNIDSTITIPASTWTHVAVVREGTSTNQTKLYINGVLAAQGTVSTDFTQTESVNIGTNRSSAENFNGFISGLRFLKGTALYTSNFTTPTEPPTPIQNTTLLLSDVASGIIDYTSKNVLETFGNARVANDVKKYGSGSIFFDGNNDFIAAPWSPKFNFGTGEFTIECWVNFSTLSGNRIILDTYTSAAAGGGYQFYWRGTGTSMVFYANGTVVAQSTFTSHVTGTWYHVACTRDSSGIIRIFIDGVQYAYVPYSSAIDTATTSRLAVGIQLTTLTNDLHGYIDDLRITKGLARYSSNTSFTPPTRELRIR